MPARQGDLRGLIVEVGDALDAAAAGIEDALALDGRLTQIERQLADLAARAGVRGVETHADAAAVEGLRMEAHARLASRGVAGADADADDLLALLDDRIASERRRRRATLRPFRIELDPIDVLAAVAIGTAASIVDAFVVRIPKDLRWGDSTQRGSWLTQTLRDLSVPADNWLARLAEVPFDRVCGLGEDVPGIGPRTHRVHTLGHDPLVGLLYGTLDILRGTLTGVDKFGDIGIVDVGSPVTRNPLVAIGLEILHLLSDLPTRMGLPLPGWSILMTSKATIAGQPLNEVARSMYLRGYDSWHLLTMATVPAAIELGLRAYWGVRHACDEEWSTAVQVAGDRAAAAGVAEHPRFVALAFAAHATAAAGNIGKLVAYGGNPLAINYAQWIRFLHVAIRAGRRGIAATPTTDALLFAYEDGAADLSRIWGEMMMPSSSTPRGR